MTVANVSRPPSVHAPYRKSFIIPLFVFQLATSTAQIAYDIILSSYVPFTPIKPAAAPTNTPPQALLLRRHRRGDEAQSQAARHGQRHPRPLHRGHHHLAHREILALPAPDADVRVREPGDLGALHPAGRHGQPARDEGVFFTGCLLAYAVVAWRRVNSGRALEMARPGRDVKDGGKLDGQGDAIPMV
ncbi:hypothetical protein V494_06085 [Pseudogymnoascus sp. VKM F-4513 (FW-928)]|nr:hypothetical protein V494_06085 [Pseudogymnoascus sp. VKM F-4513 (FW-928)]